MSFSAYARVLRAPGVARLVLISLFARLPHATCGLVFTLHVVGRIQDGGLGQDYTHAGIAGAVFTIGIAIGSPWRGRVVDSRGLRRALVPSLIVTVIGWVAAPWMSYLLLLPLCFVMGIFIIPIFPIIRQSLSVMVRPRDLPTAFALDAVVTEITFMIGPVVGTQLVLGLSSPTALIVIGIASGLAGFGLFWLNPPTRSQSASPNALTTPDAVSPTGKRTRLLTGPVLAILACSLATTFTLTGIDLGVVASLREWSVPAMTGLVLALWAGGSMIGGFFYGAMPRQVAIAPLVGALAATTAFCALAMNTLTLSIAVFVSGLFCAPTMVSVNHGLAEAVPEERRGEVMGWNGTMLQIGGAAAAPICGAAIDGFDARAGYLTTAALGAVVMVAGLALIRRRQPGSN